MTVLLVGMVLFYLRLFGGGDVKLWAAAATWYGFGPLYIQLAYVGMIGAVLGILLYVARVVAARIGRSDSGEGGIAVPRILQDGAPVPYGVAIAAGTILTLDRSPFFMHLLG